MTETKKPLPIDPKELVPAGIGFFLGLLILGLFVGLTIVMGLPTIVEGWNIPRQ